MRGMDKRWGQPGRLMPDVHWKGIVEGRKWIVWKEWNWSDQGLDGQNGKEWKEEMEWNIIGKERKE